MKRKLCIAQHMGLKFDRESAFNIQIIAHGEGHINSELFRKVLNLVQKRHFYLNAYINDSQTPEFLPFAREVLIPFEVVDVTDFDGWIEQAEEDLNQRFRHGEEPYARVKVFKKGNEFKLIVTLSHIISDGISGTYLVKDIIRVYSELLEDQAILHLEEIPSMSLSFDVFPRGIDLDYSMILSGDGCNGIDKKRIPLDKRRTRTYEIKFSQDETKKLITRCRAEGTTVYAALCASTMSAMADEIRDTYNHLNDVSVSCVSVVDHRQLTREPIKNGQLGQGALSARTYRAQFGSNSSLWEIARNGRLVLRNFIMKHGFFKILLYVRQFLSLSDEAFLQKTEFGDEYVAISYLGNFENIGETQQYGNIKINNISGAVTAQYLQGSEWGIFIGAYIFNDCLTLSLNYIDGYWDKARTIHYANKVKETICSMIV